MAPHCHYVEPFGGGLAVLLARDPDDERLWLPPHRGVSEVANDLDGRLMNFWRVLGGPLCADFCRRVEAVPLARGAWEEAAAHAYGQDQLADAVAFFVCARQSLAGRKKSFTSLTRTRLRRGRNGNVSEWVGAVEGLAAVHDRLWQRVVFECLDAVKLIKREDGPGVLQYIDPPYPHGTRYSTTEYGAYEMTDAQHAELLATLKACRGKVILSGYHNPLYDRELAGWRTVEVDLPNNAAGGKVKGRETEVLWLNY